MIAVEGQVQNLCTCPEGDCQDAPSNDEKSLASRSDKESLRLPNWRPGGVPVLGLLDRKQREESRATAIFFRVTDKLETSPSQTKS
jgi:hypothetical protein